MNYFDTTTKTPAAGIGTAVEIGVNAWRDYEGRAVGPFLERVPGVSGSRDGLPKNTVELDVAALKGVAAFKADLYVNDVECFYAWPWGDKDLYACGVAWHRHFGRVMQPIVGRDKLGLYGFPGLTRDMKDYATFSATLSKTLKTFGDLYSRLTPGLYYNARINFADLLEVAAMYAKAVRYRRIQGAICPFIEPIIVGSEAPLPLDDWKRLLDAVMPIGAAILRTSSRTPIADAYRHEFERRVA